MKCNAHICYLYFITSNPGILQVPNWTVIYINTVPQQAVG
jgi:hypothetical protein